MKPQKPIPVLDTPKRIRSRRQYVTWTKKARDLLVRHHGFRADDFIRIGSSEPTLNYTAFYPWHWQSIWRYGRPKWSGYVEKMPRGAVIYWPDGVDVCGESYDPRCAIDLLAEIQNWANFDWKEDGDGIPI